MLKQVKNRKIYRKYVLFVIGTFLVLEYAWWLFHRIICCYIRVTFVSYYELSTRERPFMSSGLMTPASYSTVISCIWPLKGERKLSGKNFFSWYAKNNYNELLKNWNATPEFLPESTCKEKHLNQLIVWWRDNGTHRNNHF